MTALRIGHGYDVHRLTAGRKLILGGVEISWEKGLLGHSDADVLTHAVMDALKENFEKGEAVSIKGRLSFSKPTPHFNVFSRTPRYAGRP